MGTTLATWRFARSGFIPWKIALSCLVCAVIGSHTGAELALLINDRLFKIIMLIIIPLTAAYVFRGHALEADPAEARPSVKKTIAIGMAVALVFGVYDGFYGPGTGTFLLLAFVGLAKMKLGEANGVTKAINLTTNVTGLAVFLMNGKVFIMLGLVAGVFSIAGNYFGTKYFTRKGAYSVKPVILLVLVIFFVKVLWEITTT